PGWEKGLGDEGHHSQKVTASTPTHIPSLTRSLTITLARTPLLPPWEKGRGDEGNLQHTLP
ncbi:MAG: hypothetical protein J5I90_21095, partial [Caldilineales bacterium]|nr:hypothetical protein [Caldilineales bacterium]